MNIRGTDFVYYQTGDIERAIEFYRDMLGLKLLGYFEEVRWAEFSTGNATFALNDPRAFDPAAEIQSGGAAIAFAVEDVEMAIKELQEKGVAITIPPQDTPVCHFACISDLDGNNIRLHQRKDGTFGD